MEVFIVLFVIAFLVALFFFFWAKNLKNTLVFIASKKSDIDDAIDKFIEIAEIVESKDIYLNDPNIKRLIYASIKLKEYLTKSYKKINESIDLQIIEEETDAEE